MYKPSPNFARPGCVNGAPVYRYAHKTKALPSGSAIIVGHRPPLSSEPFCLPMAQAGGLIGASLNRMSVKSAPPMVSILSALLSPIAVINEIEAGET